MSQCTELTGIGLGTYLDKHNTEREGSSLQTYRLVAHLNKWLVYFTFFYPVIFVFVGFQDKLYFDGHREDSVALEFCLISVFKFGIYIPRLLMVYCLIKGVSGITPKKTETVTVPQFSGTI
eukprot:snap_masked-scaffold_13-processed-gene-3.25-mRNA-1 protein AED:1.00 eAED:1.00 QI:0/-1/0/0/-1/1/1/0/120